MTDGVSATGGLTHARTRRAAMHHDWQPRRRLAARRRAQFQRSAAESAPVRASHSVTSPLGKMIALQSLRTRLHEKTTPMTAAIHNILGKPLDFLMNAIPTPVLTRILPPAPVPA